jgi:hypothetical protein
MVASTRWSLRSVASKRKVDQFKEYACTGGEGEASSPDLCSFCLSCPQWLSFSFDELTCCFTMPFRLVRVFVAVQAETAVAEQSMEVFGVQLTPHKKRDQLLKKEGRKLGDLDCSWSESPSPEEFLLLSQCLRRR